MQSLLAEISLPSIRHNAEYFGKGSPLIAVVKDDAYGHGAEEVALALHNTASSFAVATVKEGVSLRIAGVTEDILILTPPMTEEEGVRLLAYGLTASVTSFPALRLLERAAERAGTVPRVHLAVNTGMNRYGFGTEDVKRAVRRIKDMDLLLEGVFSHYFLAENDGARKGQDVLFSRAVSETKEMFPDCISHIAATGSAAESSHDAVRVGLGLYGYLPSGGSGPLHRAMKVYAYVSNSCVQTGEGIGYGFKQGDFGKLHTLRMGYGDGFFREGHETILGKLCMDAAIVAGSAEFNQKVLVADDFEGYARAHGTSVYEALVRLSSKAVKEYLR